MPTINNGSQYFGVITYTGDGSSSKTVVDTNAIQFTPDFVWIKGRSGATDHALYDAVRGTTKQLESNTTTAETTESTGVTGFVNGGFTVGNLAQVNTSGATYVAWCWKANGAGSSNTSGSITSTVSVSTTAGFSVVTYTGNGTSGATVGHGLGVTPKMIIYKRRNDVGNWIVYHTSLGNNGSNYAFLEMNTTAATQTVSSYLPVGGLSSTTFMTGTTGSINASGGTYVAYCFAEIAGFSKFGSYTGNGSADGPFSYLGFRPKYLLIKRTDTTASWYCYDAVRNTYNALTLSLFPNLSNAEETGVNELDFLSNGFKMRDTSANRNASGGTYIYMAFSENPFASNNRAR